MRILLEVNVLAILVLAAWASISLVTKQYGVSIWPME